MQIKLFKAMSDDKSHGLRAHPLSPMRFLADEDGDLGRAVDGVDILKRNISDVRIGLFITDGKHKVRTGLDDVLVVIAHVLVVIGKTVVRIIATYVLIVEPLAVIGVEIVLLDGAEVYLPADKKRIFHISV